MEVDEERVRLENLAEQLAAQEDDGKYTIFNAIAFCYKLLNFCLILKVN